MTTEEKKTFLVLRGWKFSESECVFLENDDGAILCQKFWGRNQMAKGFQVITGSWRFGIDDAYEYELGTFKRETYWRRRRVIHHTGKPAKKAANK